jgi:hypothetical protein
LFKLWHALYADPWQSSVRFAKFCTIRQVLYDSPSSVRFAKFCTIRQVLYDSPSSVRFAKFHTFSTFRNDFMAGQSNSSSIKDDIFDEDEDEDNADEEDKEDED